MRDVLTSAFGLSSSSVQDLTLLSRILHVWEYEAHGETLEKRQSDYLVSSRP